MPQQKGPSKLFAKMGQELDKAVKTHAGDETTYGRIELPPGIRNGIAQVKKCYFDTYKTGVNQGKYYLRAEAVIIEPKSVSTPQGEVEVAGQTTSFMEPCCTTKTQANKVITLEQHVANILNEMRKLGLDTSGASGGELESLAAAIQEAQPYFRFSTSPRIDQTSKEVTGVWENWHGVKGLEDYSPGETGGVEEAPGTEEPAAEAPGDDATTPDNEPAADDAVDYEKLVEDANKEGKPGSPAAKVALAAQNELLKHGADAGISKEDAEGADSWAALVEMIQAATPAAEGEGGDGAGDEASAPADEWEPSVGDVFKVQLIDPKTGKPAINKQKKPQLTEVETKTVNKANKTVTLLNLDDNKKLLVGKDKKPLAFAWDKLQM